MFNMVAPDHTKMSNVILCLALAIDHLPRATFVHYDFQILHYISHKNEIC